MPQCWIRTDLLLLLPHCACQPRRKLRIIPAHGGKITSHLMCWGRKLRPEDSGFSGGRWQKVGYSTSTQVVTDFRRDQSKSDRLLESSHADEVRRPELTARNFGFSGIPEHGTPVCYFWTMPPRIVSRLTRCSMRRKFDNIRCSERNFGLCSNIDAQVDSPGDRSSVGRLKEKRVKICDPIHCNNSNKKNSFLLAGVGIAQTTTHAQN